MILLRNIPEEKNIDSLTNNTCYRNVSITSDFIIVFLTVCPIM